MCGREWGSFERKRCDTNIFVSPCIRYLMLLCYSLNLVIEKNI